jgi:hypothetical protein
VPFVLGYPVDSYLKNHVMGNIERNCMLAFHARNARA